MKTLIARFSVVVLLVPASISHGQPVPPATGLPVSPEARATFLSQPLDPDLAYPPVKPAILLRSEWLRAEWGCKHLSADELGDNDIDDDATHVRIAVHHTAIAVKPKQLAMGEAQSLAAVKLLLCKMRNDHMSSGNTDGYAWSDIGYHYLIDWKGRVWQGRKVDKRGANVGDMNTGTIGVALLGDFEQQQPPSAQLLTLKHWLAYLVYGYKIAPTAIHGHHEYVVTDCPGRNLSRYQEYLEPYDPAKATPLRRIRMALLPLWQLMQARRVVSAGTRASSASMTASHTLLRLRALHLPLVNESLFR